MLENIPQFIVVIREIFLYRNSITFLQAGNPLFALCMVYKLFGPMLGDALYSLLIDYGFCGIICPLFCCLLLITPQYYVWKMFDARMLKNEEIPMVLFHEGLLVNDYQITFKLLLNFTLFAIVVAVFIFA